MAEAFAAVAWVHEHDRHAGGAVQQPPSFARAAATKNVSVGGAVGETGKRRAPNVFQGAGKMKCCRLGACRKDVSGRVGGLRPLHRDACWVPKATP